MPKSSSLTWPCAVDHHVAGLEVAVHHQLRVGGGHRLHHVDEQPQAAFDIEPAVVAPAVDGLAAHQFQHQVGLAAIAVAGHPGVEQARDVRVFQPRQDAAFAFEALAGLGAVQAPVHQLDGGLAVVAAVAAPRQPDAGHAAFTQRRLDGPRAHAVANGGAGRCGLSRTCEEVFAAGGFLPFEHAAQQGGVLRCAQLQRGQPGGTVSRRQVQRLVQQRADARPGGGVRGGWGVGVGVHQGGGARMLRRGLCTWNRKLPAEDVRPLPCRVLRRACDPPCRPAARGAATWEATP